MVLLDEEYTICTIRNTIENSEIKKLSLTVRPSYTVSKLYSDVRTQLDINDFSLVLENLPSTNHVPLSLKENKTLGEVGIVFKKSHRNIILVLPPIGGKKKVEKCASKTNFLSDVPADIPPIGAKKKVEKSTSKANLISEVSADVPLIVTKKKPEKSASKTSLISEVSADVPEIGAKKKTEKSASKTSLISDVSAADVQKQADQIKKENSQAADVVPAISGEPIDVQLEAPAKKKIIKVKTVKTGTKTVKIKSEKTTTTTTSENGVTEVKKKTIKKQTDTTTIQLPNGITNGLTSEECIVTNSFHTTNGNHFEENIEVTSHQSEINPINAERALSLTDRCSLSSELEVIEPTKSIGTNHLEINGIPDKNTIKDRSASPVEVANYSFVVGKKPLKQRVHSKSESNLDPKTETVASINNNNSSDVTSKLNDTSIVNSDQITPDLSTTKENKLKDTSNKEKISKFGQADKAQTNVRSELSPARFQIDLTVPRTDLVDHSEKECTAPFLRSEVSPARFTIKLAKKKVDPKAEAGREAETNHKAKISLKAKVGSKVDVPVKAEVDYNIKLDSEAEVTQSEVGSTSEIGHKSEVFSDIKDSSNTKVGSDAKVSAQVEVTSISEVVPSTEVSSHASSKIEISPKADAAEVEVKAKSKSEICLKGELDPKAKVDPKAEVDSKAEVDPKAVVGFKAEVDPKAEVDSKAEVDPKAELGSKAIVDPKTKVGSKIEVGAKSEICTKTEIGTKKLKKSSDSLNVPTINGTTEVKKKLVRKVKDSTSPPSEIKKKIVKKVVGATSGVTENGNDDLKVKVVKKKSELNTTPQVVPEVKAKVVKKKLEPAVSTTQELNAIEEQPQLNHIESAKVEQPEQTISLNNASVEKTVNTQIESKMDDKKDYEDTPLFIETMSPSDLDQKVRRKIELKSDSSREMEEKNRLGSDEDLALGASASPVESKSETSNNYIPLAICDTPSRSTDYGGKLYSGPKPSFGYVGLVNQAMTCYLNSLLQALFMTPEFRNALYNWEFDGHEESKSIPYQLQKLFLNLQTSSKVAIETTDLTKSFGWTSSDAWHQHDIQELCRVMFDALEQKFKNTQQADLINRLYEGKMIDYVKCLECSTEKTREDTLLDIPLPVRPFGSNMAYGSVEEALRAFVQPETLDGNNQYFCDKCDKKCDAHKGLKFTKFPYILTLHLKRFDFDYNTLHRIKLNDKVTFPQLLNLNSFVKESDNIGFVQHTTNGGCSSEHGSIESAIKCDDCSTTDSGSALEEEGTTFTAGGNNNNNDGDLQEDDEGIDMSTSTDTKNPISNESGPYIYELFAIMIHSGSASGGHYYAYIKDFNNGEWYCFNDQTVISASHEDIERSFGGGSAKTYYSSAYNSSTNAYMLMYRQQDPSRNDAAIKVEEFPPHIKKLLRDLRQRDEMERQNKARETDLLKLKVYFFNPKTQRMQDARIFMTSDSDLKMTLEDAHSHFNIDKLAPIERCRLVGYCHSDESIIRSYEGREDEPLTKVLFDLNPLELLLEVRPENSAFEVYPVNGVLTKLHKVDLATGDVDLPITFRAITTWTVPEYKSKIAEKLALNVEQIILAVLKPYSNNARIIDEDVPHRISKQDRVFAAVSTSPFEDCGKLTKIVERFEHIITLFFLLPATDKETLEKMSIPSYVEKQSQSPSSTTSTPSPPKPTPVVSTDVVDAIMHAAPLPIQNHTSTSDCSYQQVPSQLELESCSEDSSLSDGDRTLVDSAPDMADVSSTNNSPTCSDTQMSSMEYQSKRYNDFDCDDDNETVEVTRTRNYYFKAVYFEEPYKDDENIKTNRMLKVLVDKGMIIGNLKRALEPFIKVPKEYFKIFKTSSNTETECHRLTESLNIFSDNELLVIELGRALRKGEYKCKISYLKLSQIRDDMEQLTFMCDWILRNGANVGQTKREIIAHLATLGHDIQYENCRLRHQNRRLPVEIYLDDQKFGDDIRLSENMEVILQELEETSQPYTDGNDKCLFVRRWNPSTMTIGGFQEITISENSELKNVLSSISGIPEENIEYAMPTGLFPRYNINVLTMHTTSLTWCSSPVKADEWPLNNARNSDCFIFRDKTEPLKQLTPEERNELKEKERLRTGTSSTYSSYSPRRERGLKIDV